MNRRAFTLIELLIVVAIIGILAAIAVPNFLNARARANIARVWGDFKAISTALEMYAMDQNNGYPYTNTNQQSNPYPMRHLTTPIAYMSGFPAKDPFIPYHDTAGQPGGTLDKWWNPYWLVTYPVLVRYIDEAPKLRWQLGSVGPDHYFDCSPFVSPAVRHSACWLAYHPTNGLRSWGEIWMTGPSGITSDGANMDNRPDSIHL
ncbi:MAG: prepilin-type N-terminal cleavage/methylation domain-containing protein [bacterium]